MCSGDIIRSSPDKVLNNKLQEGINTSQADTSSEGQNNTNMSNLQLNKLNDKNDREKYSNTNLSTYQANVTVSDDSDDSDDFDVNLLKEAEKSFHLSPGNSLTSQNSTFNGNEDGPMFCECYEKYDYNKAVNVLKRIDDIPVDDHIWTSISNEFIIEDIALKYGISSDKVVQILEDYKKEQ